MFSVPCPVYPVVPTNLPPPPQLWYPTRDTLAQRREEAAWREGTEMVGHQDTGPLRPPQEQLRAKAHPVGGSWGRAGRCVVEGPATGRGVSRPCVEGTTATSPCPHGCPQATAGPVKLPWGHSGRHAAVPALTCPCSAPAWGSIRYVARPSEKTPLQTEVGVSGCRGVRPPSPPGSAGTHRRPWQLERAAKERGCPRIRPW